jgi:YVTN family beta-propeller protein
MRLLIILVVTAVVLTPVFGQYLEGVIDIGTSQVAVLCNPLSNKIYTANGDANSVTIIDGATRQIIATKSVSGDPVDLCLNTVSNRVYCRGLASSRLAIIDGVTDSVKRLTIPHGGPAAFAYNATSNLLYVGCDDEGTLVVVDGASDTILSELHLEPRWVTTMFWNPATNHLFVGTFQDTMFVVDCQTSQVRARWYVQPFDVWCCSRVTGRVYTASSNTLWVFNPYGDSLLSAIPLGSMYLCAVPFPDKVYIAGHEVLVLDGSTNVITDTIPVGGGAMVCDTLKGKVYAVSGGACVFDARGDTLLTTIPLPAFSPFRICRNPLDGRVYVTDQQGDSVYVLRDTMPGIEESHKPQASSQELRPTIVRCLPAGVVAFDATGRRALSAKPGVYFVRDEGRGAGDVGRMRKVVVQR